MGKTAKIIKILNSLGNKILKEESIGNSLKIDFEWLTIE